MIENRNRKGILIIVSVVKVLLLLIISGGYLFLHNKSYKNQAIECGDAIYLNEIKYSPVASSDLKEYTISNVLICKTDTGMKLYKINEYPDYEYTIVTTTNSLEMIKDHARHYEMATFIKKMDHFTTNKKIT